MCTDCQMVWSCNFCVHISKLNWLYSVNFINSYDEYIVWAYDFALPGASVGVGEIIELLKQDKKLVGRSVLHVKGYVVTNSVYIHK